MLHAPTTENKTREGAANLPNVNALPAYLPARETSPRIAQRPAFGNRAGGGATPLPLRPSQAPVLQRKCACGGSAGATGECANCKAKSEATLQRRAAATQADPQTAPPIVHDTLRSPGQPLDPATRAFMEPRFGQDFSHVRVHTDATAAQSARAVNALAYTVKNHVAFDAGQYQPQTTEGKQLLAHELTHVLQQSTPYQGNAGISLASDTSPEERNAQAVADAVITGGSIGRLEQAKPAIQRRAAPYIKKVTVHLTPKQSADLEWEGDPPPEATGKDHFMVSTGKGYSDDGDPAGTCTRTCCNDPLTQCAPPYNQPSKVGACCTYFGDSFWTGTPVPDHNGWLWWTPVQPYYSSRGIALHQHPEVTGDPIGHGCVRMEEPNAKRIYDYSNGKATNVTIDGRAAPVLCKDDRRCAGAGGTHATSEEGDNDSRVAEETEEAVPGLEGELT